MQFCSSFVAELAQFRPATRQCFVAAKPSSGTTCVYVDVSARKQVAFATHEAALALAERRMQKSANLPFRRLTLFELATSQIGTCPAYWTESFSFRFMKLEKPKYTPSRTLTIVESNISTNFCRGVVITEANRTSWGELR